MAVDWIFRDVKLQRFPSLIRCMGLLCLCSCHLCANMRHFNLLGALGQLLRALHSLFGGVGSYLHRTKRQEGAVSVLIQSLPSLRQ